MRSSRAIQAAMRSQGLGDGDDETAQSVSQLSELAEKYFPGLMDILFRIFLTACEREGRTAVVDKLSNVHGVCIDQSHIVQSYFDTHIADVPEDKRRKLGPDMMSVILQSIDNAKMRSMFMANGGAAFQNSSSECATEGDNKVTTSASCKWRTKEFTVGSCGSNELSRVFNDPKALKITLLLNRLLNTSFWQYLEERALLPCDFRINHIGKESETSDVFEVLILRANEKFNFLSPILGVAIGPNPEVGGTTDIVVEVCGRNERQEFHSECTAILELAKPCMAYRAANILVFGDKPLKEDYSALERHIDIADPVIAQKLKEVTEQFELCSSSLAGIKRVVVSNVEHKPVYGYTRYGEDITSKLRYCSLEWSVNGFHSGLGNVSMHAILNGSSHIALSDGFTFIAMHLRDLQEQESGLVEANFNDHYAIDLTENGSGLQTFQYIINAGYRSSRVRRAVEILLHAAHEEFRGIGITAAKSAAFCKQLKLLSGYKFHSRAYTHYDSAADARIFTSHRTPIIDRTIERFGQVFPALTQCGEYESSAFGILENFKVSGFQVVLETENSDPGRSRRITKVNFYGHDEPAKCKHKETCILTEHECDAASVERMERELGAYRRIAQLAAGDQRCFAKLIAFGAIDMNGADPRLFILTEYVEDCRSILPSTEEDGMEDYETFKKRQTEEGTEIGKVYDILQSVGVYHNDLEERNFKWQEVDGERFIKVFDLDYATFDDINSGGL